MALTYSEMLQLDFELFDFELINVVDNQNFSISNIEFGFLSFLSPPLIEK